MPPCSTYRERGITPGDYGIRGIGPGYGAHVKTLSEMSARRAELPLAADPGTVYQYSVGYDVMGLIIERVSGTSLEAYLLAQPIQRFPVTQCVSM